MIASPFLLWATSAARRRAVSFLRLCLTRLATAAGAALSVRYFEGAALPTWIVMTATGAVLTWTMVGLLFSAPDEQVRGAT